MRELSWLVRRTYRGQKWGHVCLPILMSDTVRERSKTDQQGWCSWCLILMWLWPSYCLVAAYLSFVLGCGVSYFGEFQHTPVDACLEASCDFGVLTEEGTSFYSTIFIPSFHHSQSLSSGSLHKLLILNHQRRSKNCSNMASRMKNTITEN